MPREFRAIRFAATDLTFQAIYPHRHDFYEVIFVKSGAGTHVLDFVSHDMAPPCLYFVAPGQVHFWKHERKLEGGALVFTKEFALPAPEDAGLLSGLVFFHGPDEAPMIPLNVTGEERLPLIEDLFEKMCAECEAEAFGRDSVLRAYLHILLVNAQRWSRAGGLAGLGEAGRSLAHRFRELAATHAVEQRSVSWYAQELRVSAGHLSDTIKEAAGKQPGQLIREQVILEAKRLLAHSAMTVAEVGYTLHFDDPSYFSRFFKRETGESPGDFLDRIRKQHQLSGG